MTDTMITTGIDSPEAAPLIAELDHEYSTRYRGYTGFDEFEDASEDLDIYPPILFEEPLGTLLLLRRDGETIAGGGFIYLDEETAEVKRVWTSSAHRRQGLSRRIMEALEEAAAARGYRRIYLTTGPRQPEATGLYVSMGYTPLFDTDADPEEIAHLAFEKDLDTDPDVTHTARQGLIIQTELADRATEQRTVVEETFRRRPPPRCPTRRPGLTTSGHDPHRPAARSPAWHPECHGPASANTIASYRDTWRILLKHLSSTLGVPADRIDFDALTAANITGFLEHDRGNNAKTHNTRLTAIHAALPRALPDHPEHAATITQVLAIPPKRTTRPVIEFLTPGQADALLAALDQQTWTGRRDHALLIFAIQTGLRISEICALILDDLHLGTGAQVTCTGKDRRQRSTPLTRTTVDTMKRYGPDPRKMDPGVAPYTPAFHN